MKQLSRLNIVDASSKLRYRWLLGGLSELTGIPKKHWRKAIAIAENPKIILEAEKDGRIKKQIFRYGFCSWIKKDPHKDRKILEPHPNLQKVLRPLGQWVVSLSPAHPRAFGFVLERNGKMAVEELQFLLKTKKPHHFGVDIADAFPSIDDKMVFEALKKLGIESCLAEIISWLVTYQYDGKRRLPQGASSSPPLLNLVYQPMCDEFEKICTREKIFWSIYADDINFVSANLIPEETKQELSAVPTKFGFKIKSKKTKDNLGKTIPHLLGLTVVDRRIHISRRKKNKIRQILYAIEKFEAYSPETALGYKAYLKLIYGKDEKNWPGWVSLHKR